MSYTHNKGYSAIDSGYAIGKAGAEVPVIGPSGQLYQSGVAVTSSAAELNIMDGVTASAAELNLIDGSIAGTAVASKALVLGANKNADVLAVADLKLGAGAGTSVTSTAAELNTLAGVTAGTAVASKAAVLGASKNLDTLSVATLSATTNVAVGGGTAITKIVVYSQSIDVASVAANTTAEQTFTVTGLTTADKVIVNKPSLSAGLGIVNARVSAADTLAITFVNATSAAIDPAAETYAIVALRS